MYSVKIQHKVRNLVEDTSSRVFEFIHADVYGPFPTEQYGYSEDVWTGIDDVSYFTSVFILKQYSDSCFTLDSLFNYIERQFGTMITPTRRRNGGESIINELKNLS
jgi:hypothetical protein